MLEYSEIKEKKHIIYQGEPYEVISSHVFRKQQRKPVNATKLKNLITGKVVENSFHVSDKVEEADIERKDIKFIYENRGEYWFSEKDDPSKRFMLASDMIGDTSKFLKSDLIVEALVFDDPSNPSGQGKIIGVNLPIKIDFVVKEAHPAVKGNTAQGATKNVVLENGTELQVPMFIKQGDIVRVNTETGQYTDRVS